MRACRVWEKRANQITSHLSMSVVELLKTHDVFDNDNILRRIP